MLVVRVLAVVVFVLAGLGYNPFGQTQLDLVAWGLALLALSLIPAPSWGSGGE